MTTHTINETQIETLAPHMTRGDVVETPTLTGRFVGLSSGGHAWIAWHEKKFETMCDRFDALEARLAAKKAERAEREAAEEAAHENEMIHIKIVASESTWIAHAEAYGEVGKVWGQGLDAVMYRRTDRVIECPRSTMRKVLYGLESIDEEGVFEWALIEDYPPNLQDHAERRAQRILDRTIAKIKAAI